MKPQIRSLSAESSGLGSGKEEVCRCIAGLEKPDSGSITLDGKKLRSGSPSGWTQDKTGDAVGANAQAGNSLDLRGDLPNPRRIDASELHKLPRVEARTADPHDPGKEIVYSGTPLVEVLKAGGLLLDPGMAGIRETVTMTVLVEATDGYRAV